ncbi:MAG: threonine synthase [Alphaproteobacteria bacterium]
MRYISTRGSAPVLGFEDVLLAGLARDGGLYVPDRWPRIADTDWAALAKLSYADLAVRILQPFVGSALTEPELAGLVHDAYRGFDHKDVAPLVSLGRPNEHLLELFHGPTLAFKDFALQLVGRMFDHVLAKRGQRITIVGATSGDTGSAAIAACRDRAAMDIFILHPKGRVSEVQRRQMTTVLSKNVHNIAVEGTFDDCQDLVKALFNDAPLRDALNLSAVNSINWARIVAQIVYYVWAGLKLGAPARAIAFAVPTGNFGNVYAGYAARAIGLPVAQLIVGSNRNDILTRFLATGVMAMRPVEPSLSPSMDIQISSNFERLLFDLYDRDAQATAGLLTEFRASGELRPERERWKRALELFAGYRLDDAATLAAIKRLYDETAMLVDPHSIVGIEAGRARRKDPALPLVALATAHPAKFPDAVERATGIRPPLPAALADLYQRPERCAALPNDAAALKAFIKDALR